MPLIKGLKKMFAKRDRFAPPSQYMLTSREKEGVIVFFAIIGIIVFTALFLILFN